jgi:AcrR family transcriptional regulator
MTVHCDRFADHHAERADRRRRRHERHRAETRDDILAAAREVLLERGAADLSLREIARRAGYSPGALYKYFEDKGDLIRALADGAMEALVEALATVPDGRPPDERAVEIGMAYLAFARTHPEDVELIAVNEAAIHAQPSSPQHERLEAVVIGVMREGAESGVFKLPVHDAEYAAFGAWAFVQGLASFERQQGSELAARLRDRQRQLLGAYVNGLKIGWPAVADLPAD